MPACHPSSAPPLAYSQPSGVETTGEADLGPESGNLHRGHSADNHPWEVLAQAPICLGKPAPPRGSRRFARKLPYRRSGTRSALYGASRPRCETRPHLQQCRSAGRDLDPSASRHANLLVGVGLAQDLRRGRGNGRLSLSATHHLPYSSPGSGHPTASNEDSTHLVVQRQSCCARVAPTSRHGRPPEVL